MKENNSCHRPLAVLNWQPIGGVRIHHRVQLMGSDRPARQLREFQHTAQRNAPRADPLRHRLRRHIELPGHIRLPAEGLCCLRNWVHAQNLKHLLDKCQAQD
jgi:hypothetical protein